MNRKERVDLGYNHFQGVPYPPLVKPEHLEKLAAFKTREDDIYLCTYAKSGTTWMQQILRLLANNGEADPNRTVNDDVPFLEEKDPAIVEQRASPRIIKTHLCYSLVPKPSKEQRSPKYIYVARNPKDVAVSLYHHTKAFTSYRFEGTWEDFFQLFLQGKVDYGRWFEHVLEWWNHRHDPNILFLKYEDMQRDLEGVIRQVAKFCGFSVPDRVIQKTMIKSTFDHMSKDASTNYSWDNHCRRQGSEPFIRKGKVGDWKNYFSAAQNSIFDTLYDGLLQDSGLEFEF